MLTDIFLLRYAAMPMWSEFTDRERRLIVQTFNLAKEMVPYYNNDGKELPTGKAFWKNVHARIANELGQKSLSETSYFYNTKWLGKESTVSGTWSAIQICETWAFLQPTNPNTIDQFVKSRISLVEIVFRLREEAIQRENAEVPAKILKAKSNTRSGYQIAKNPEQFYRSLNNRLNNEFRRNVDELNTRFRQAVCKLHYHNGFIQISEDELVVDLVEGPFWKLVAGPDWKNVDTDMKEAIDRRDSGGVDPALYAARALESTIKIISDKKGWTQGSERGAHNFIDNLAKTSSAYVEAWEAEAMKLIFSKVRNPFGHGAGSAPMPILSGPQTDWAIEACMSWTKSLIRRL